MSVTGDTVSDGVLLIPLLIALLDKTIAAQPNPQVQQVNEAGAVANLVARLLTTDHGIPGKCRVASI